MISRTLLSLGLLAFSSAPAFALVHPAPRETDTSADGYDPTGWTPKPTPAPVLAGSLAELKYHKRQDSLIAVSETCGWYTGDPNSPFSCAAGNACAFNSDQSYFGCCSTDAAGYLESSACDYIATPSSSCLDYTQASDCDDACYATNYVCDAASPYCATALLDDGDGLVLRHYACLTASGITFIVEPTTTESAAATTDIIITSATSRTLSAGLPTQSTQTTSTQTSSSSTTTIISSESNSGTSIPVSLGHGHKSNVGAIAGGVVGGLALLAIAAVAAIFFLRKKKKDQRKSIMPEVSQM